MLVRSRPAAAALAAVALLTALVSAPGGTPTASAGDKTPGPAAPAERAVVRAERVLTEAREVLAGGPAGRDATMVLRDLALALGDLPPAQRAEGERLLARPQLDGERQVCGDVACVHWATFGTDAPNATDVSGNGVPDYVDDVLAIVTSVHRTYVRAGYKQPKSDGTTGGGGAGKSDIYLADVGAQRLYGYCAGDRQVPAGGPYDMSAHCVLDNDYSPAQFDKNTPLENLQVTAAHEYFHAVQFAYDAAEDAWFMEATAAWVEDEMYDAVDDNLQYLRLSPMRQPATPLDQGSGLRVYGSWTFFRFITEQLPAQKGGLPTFVRDVLRKADGSRGKPDQYSTQAVATVLRARKTNLTTMFARFAAANRRPAQTYSEGAQYPRAAANVSLKLGPRAGATRGVKLKHLAVNTVRVTPKSAVGKGWKLQVKVDMGPKSTQPAAMVTVIGESGKGSTKRVALRPDGRGALKVPFAARSIRYVEVTLVNASARFKCWQRTVFSCQGRPLDNAVPAKLQVRTTR